MSNTKKPHEFVIGDKIKTPSQGILTIIGEPWVRPGYFHVLVPTDLADNTAFDQDVDWELAD